LADKALDRDRAGRAGFGLDQAGAIGKLLDQLARANGYEVRSFGNLPYEGGMDGKRGKNMLYTVAHIVQT
jgi:hypothetical protein